MAFKPRTSGSSNSGGKKDRPFDPADYPVPRKGLRKGRISLIIDLGIQKQEPLWVAADNPEKVVTENTPGAVLKERKDSQQIVVFADLTHDKVKYGGGIGEKHYRLMLNKTYNGEVHGINFGFVPQKNADGDILVEGGGTLKQNPKAKWLPMVLAPSGLPSKLAKLADMPEICLSGDVSKLLNVPLMFQVDVKETEDKKGRLDVHGNPVVYKNVHFKGVAQVPEEDDGNPQHVNELEVEPMCITFDGATKEQVQFIRYNLRQKIKLASDYPGSAMQRAIEAFEAEQGNSQDSDDDSDADDTPAEDKKETKAESKPPVKKAAAEKKKKEPEVVPFDDLDDDAPF